MNKAFGFATFTIGAVVGSLVTWRILKKKYEQITQEEIQSVKDAFKQKYEKEKTIDEATPKVTSEEKKEYAQIIAEEGYNPVEDDGFESVEDEEETVREFTYGKPFVITPEEFDEMEDYKLVGLSYYADKQLANDQGKLYDIEVVGQDAINRIGEYEEDYIHVRNIELKTDFEILLDPRKYSEVYRDRD